MKCFYHHDRDAVGTCKSCGRGLCPACAADLGKGLACVGRCESDARALIELVDSNIRLHPTTERMMRSSGVARVGATLFFLVTGAVFVIWSQREGEPLSFAGVVGVCLLAYGLFNVYQAVRIAAAGPRTPANSKCQTDSR